jgi:hypothetical protein
MLHKHCTQLRYTLMGYLRRPGDDNNTSCHHHRLKEIERDTGSKLFGWSDVVV